MSLFSKVNTAKKNPLENPPEVPHKRTHLELLAKEKELLGFFLTGHPMDKFTPILKRLSCVALRRAEQLSHHTVFRSAIIVESVQTRVSAKSQKKFAILEVSDGLERYELPIWPELYEEKKHLLQENQLLYTVLHVECKEGATRLSCHWLDDLTLVNEAMIQASDNAYDRAKMHLARFRDRAAQDKPAKEKEKAPPANPEPKKQAPVKPMMPSTYTLRIDADAMRFEHILAITELLKKHAGPHVLKMQFESQQRPIATLHIDSSFHVDWKPELAKALAAVPGVAGVGP